jgi:hypothetical protein
MSLVLRSLAVLLAGSLLVLALPSLPAGAARMAQGVGGARSQANLPRPVS